MTLLEFLEHSPAQRSLLGSLMIGFANGYVSGFVVLRKTALEIGTLSHSLLPGIALAVLIYGLSDWSTLFGAVLAALMVGLGSLLVSRTSRLDRDTAMGILYTTAFAGGIIILTKLSLQQKLQEWIFGSIQAMQDSDLWTAFGISLVAVLLLTALQRPLLIYLFEPNVAASLGVPVRFLSYALYTLVVLVLVSSLQAVGCILSVGLLITPAATVYLLTDNANALFWGGATVGTLAALIAFCIQLPLDWPLGPTILVVLGALFVTAYLLGPRYGLLAQWKKSRTAQ
jgi:manganese transport system permease protein